MRHWTRSALLRCTILAFFSILLKRRRYLALRGAFEKDQIAAFDPPESSYVPGAGVEEFSSNQEVLAVVQQGMAELTPKQQEVVQLVCFEGLLLSEIVERMGESLGNVRHHYYRGIEKLREFVKRNLDSEEKQRAAVRGGEK